MFKAKFYHSLRYSGFSPLSAGLLSFFHGIAWLVLRLESPAWQRVLANSARWYPHISNRPPRLGDPIRYVIQSLWLLIVLPISPRVRQAQWSKRLSLLGQARAWLSQKITNATRSWQGEELPPIADVLNKTSKTLRPFAMAIFGVFTTALVILCITEPFDFEAQLVFVFLLWGLALLIRDIPGRFAMVLLVMLSLIVSSRYLWWRYTGTLNWNDSLDLVCGLTLLAAESYAWLILLLGYVQTIWPLKRQPQPLPRDLTLWPSVDVMIPTYNEDLAVVRNTVYAALGLDWPKDKLNIYILDDGRRDIFRQFAAEVGVGYIIRPDNRHAKAGNLNYALTQTQGTLVAIFDCDHIPARSFLQLTTGWFLKDDRLALVQTPHTFYSPDPFERNLNTFHSEPNEGELFYGLVQDGNDLWNATFFCGSCAVLRRAAINDIGGFAVETVTEDAHTALRLHRRGWHSAYLRIPLAAGLATESLSAHIGQRIRWARGMVQILRTDNPLFGRGLNLFQRLCYANAMLHFLAGIPRLIFLTAPLAFLLLHAYIIYAPASLILIYVLPHMIHSSLANARIQGPFRKSFQGEVYETVLAWYIAWPTTLALLNPKKGRFNVTVKGGLMEHDQFDWRISTPYFILAGLNFLGLGFAIWRLMYGPEDEMLTVIVSSLWVIYNLLIIGSAVAVAAEVRQVRLSPRVNTGLAAALRLESGHLYPATLTDYSDQGAGIQAQLPLVLLPDTKVTLVLWRSGRAFTFPALVRRHQGHFLGLSLDSLSHEQRTDFVRCTFERADAWLNKQEQFSGDQPLQHFWDMLALGAKGYARLCDHLPRPIKRLLYLVVDLPRWLYSFCPRIPRFSAKDTSLSSSLHPLAPSAGSVSSS